MNKILSIILIIILSVFIYSIIYAGSENSSHVDERDINISRIPPNFEKFSIGSGVSWSHPEMKEKYLTYSKEKLVEELLLRDMEIRNLTTINKQLTESLSLKNNEVRKAVEIFDDLVKRINKLNEKVIIAVGALCSDDDLIQMNPFICNEEFLKDVKNIEIK